MHTETYLYSDGEQKCEGLVAREATLTLPAPVVVVCHHWWGRDALMDSHAQRMARLGYIGFAADTYGGHRVAKTPDEASALMSALTNDRAKLRSRLRAIVGAARRIPGADGQRVAVIGFCFGGLCAFDVARDGCEGVVGVAGFHGLFAPPNIGEQQRIHARVLALHGYADPMATPDAMVAFAKEMTDAGAHWEIDAYGNAVHAFTNPDANDRAQGMGYDERIANRAFTRLESFLRECFGR